MGAGAYAHMYVESDADVGHLPPLFSIFILRQGLSLYIELTHLVRAAGQQGRDSSCPRLPSADITGTQCHTWLSCGCWVLNSSSHNKHITD